MKQSLLLLFISISSFVYGQVPNQINYQAVARNSVGNVIPNKKIMVRLSIREETAAGTILYKETRTITTNNFGLFTIAIGSAGADNSTGTISGIDWSTAAKFIQVEVDPEGGSNFINMGAAQLLSVPYALHAGTASVGTLSGNAGGALAGTYPNPSIANGAVTQSMIASGVIPTSLPPNGNAGGDLNGTYPNPTIINGAVTANKLADNSVTTSKVVDGSITLAKLGADVIFGSGGNPTGPAGGDLIGAYPNPVINNGVITTTKLADNSVTTSKIVNASVTSAKLAAGVIPTSLPPNGTAAGDLTGSYPSPTLNKIQGVNVTATGATTGQVLKFNGTSWIPGTDNTGSGGSNPTGPAGGDLTGSYPNPTINNGVITTTKLADNSITTSKIVDASVTSAKLAAGVIPTSLPPNGTAGGDLTGSYPSPTINNGAITTNKLADGAVTNTKVADNAITTSKVLDGSITMAKLGPDVIFGSGGSPSGPAGGDLSGTYPSPNLAAGSVTISKIDNGAVITPKIADGAVSTNKLADNSVTTLKIADASVTSTKLAAGVIPTSLPPSGGASGDLGGSYPGPIVNKILGVSVSNTGLASGMVLKYNGTQWAPAADNTGAFSMPYSATASSASNLFSLTNSGTGAALEGINSNTGIGVVGKSTQGIGVVGESANGNAASFSVTNGSNSLDAVYVSNIGQGNGIYTESAIGNGLTAITNGAFSAAIWGFNNSGGVGIYGVTHAGPEAGLKGATTFDGGTALEAELMGSATTGNLALFKVSGTNVARINENGRGFFNGGTQNNGADIAEAFDVTGNIKEYEAGDVLAISTKKDRAVEKSSEPYSTLVAGVYATKPGVLLTEENIGNDLTDKVPMGVIGVIPTKVCIQGGSIKRGDLLVTSSIPGVAMKADPEKVRVGQVIGKALEDYSTEGIGKIKVLVSIK